MTDELMKKCNDELTDLTYKWEKQGFEFNNIVHLLLSHINYQISVLDVDDSIFEKVMDLYSNERYCEMFKLRCRQARKMMQDSMSKNS